MFNPIERGRQLREQREYANRGSCGFSGFEDKYQKIQLHQGTGDNPPFAGNVRITADRPVDAPTGEKIRNVSAVHPQLMKASTSSLSANPQKPQREAEITLQPLEEATTAANVETLLANLCIVGRGLGGVQELARTTMLQLSQKAAAELAVALDDAFEVSPDTATAVAQCRKLLTNPAALEAAKALWPRLPPTPAPACNNLFAQAPPQQEPSSWGPPIPP
ncbi:hypothetical protein [Vreelandella indica]|uniref:hypothetical protein n=1 Tax=Vreelandella indica TaxID=3126500 RepID=UPI00300E3D8D